MEFTQTLLLSVGMVLRDAQLIAEHEVDDPLFADCPQLAFVQGFGVPQYAALVAAVSDMMSRFKFDLETGKF